MLAHGPAVITNGLVLCLDAADRNSYPTTGTTWTDLSGRGNNGTLTNGPTYSNGSIVFDGVDDYVNLGNSKFQYQDNFSVEAWCNFPNVPNNPGSACGARHPIVYNHDYGYNLLIQSNGKVNWNIYNTFSTSISILSANSIVGSNYFHVVGTKMGTTCSLYVNGLFESSANLTTNAVYYIGEPFVIGGYAVCGPNRFYSTGSINIVRMYNRALSATEIQQNFNALRGRFNI